MAGSVLDEFVTAVGEADAVAARGGATQWGVGGVLRPGTREVQAPSGIVEYAPEEMTVTVLAGTSVGDLHAELATHAQRTALAEADDSTVGGALAVGRDTIHRRGRGLVRDSLLQARYVSAEGRLVTAGGPTVKNVTGFDLCRLLVGSLGTLGLMGEVILRTKPVPPESRWLRGPVADPFGLAARLLTASSVLWDGEVTWVHLEGHGVDVAADRAGPLAELEDTSGPPPLPAHRWAMTPAALADFDQSATGAFVAEIGVGTVHAAQPPPDSSVDPGLRRLNEQVKHRFDPTGRLNPGRDPLHR
ncbi:MAG: FAD-binding protein [Acidimicrobiales bacterium]